MITCSSCKQEKAESEFYWSGGRHSGYCKPCQIASVNARRQEVQKARTKQRRRLYGLTEEGYQRRLQEQRGVCAICRRPPSGTIERDYWSGETIEKELVVDHDHQTGEVRGLLCVRCNNLLGRLENNKGVNTAEWVSGAYDYLTQARKQVTQESVSIPTPPRIRATLEAAVVPAGTVVETDPVSFVIGEEPPSLRDRALQVDLMPADGDFRVPSSNYSVRRRAQTTYLQAAWGELFPKAPGLQAASAKRMLQLSEDSAEEVLDRLEAVQARNVQSPLAYVLRVMEREAAQRRRPPAPASPQVRPVDIGKPEREPDYYLAAPTEKTRRIEEKARALGLLDDRDED